ncbi:S41 family peptidase [Candidatus Gracilibacteria bacterium]|nr:S41 family peptidase [Candidatus Gracilibacteria bacterium]
MYEIENRNIGKKIFIVAVVAVFSFLVGWQASSFGIIGDIFDTTGTDTADDLAGPANNENLNLFWTVWDKLDSEYVDQNVVASNDKIYGAIKGLVDSFEDPYTVFMTPEESKQFGEDIDGKLEGIGAELTVEDNLLKIVTPMKASPAEKAGLLPGDIIYKIDGKIAADLSLFDAIMSIRGEKGTSVILTIGRKNLENTFDVSIIRDSIEVDSVTMEKTASGIVYLSVNRFNEKTDEQFGKAISEMILNEPKGLIIDLRYNGGGYLSSAVELLSYILPKGTSAVEIRQRGKENEMMTANGNPKLTKVPIVVLVNEGSASASEILAGAVQDNKRGIVMGTKTYGKGSVQEVSKFEDGSSIRMTIAKWFTPNGRSINKVGLTPDIIVEIKEEDLKNKKDSQKEAAIKYLEELR